MNTSLKWIKDLVPGLDCTPQDITVETIGEMEGKETL